MSQRPVGLIGLDVGGTKIAGGLVAWPSGKVLASHFLPTQPQRGGQAVLADALAVAQSLFEASPAYGCEVAGIGVGVCELVDAQGQVTSGHTVDWVNLPVQGEFDRLAPAVVEADVRCHALAEACFGAGHSQSWFTFVSVGTGISACLVQDGVPLAGARGNALILASSPLTTTCTNCGTVLRPVLEDFAGGPGLVSRYGALSGRRIGRAEEVLAAAEAGEATAREVVRTGGEALGVSIGWLVNVLDPEIVVVGGGLGSAPGLYWESLVTATRQHIWAEATRALPILQARIGPEAGMVGAAVAAARRLKLPQDSRLETPT